MIIQTYLIISMTWLAHVKKRLRLPLRGSLWCHFDWLLLQRTLNWNLVGNMKINLSDCSDSVSRLGKTVKLRWLHHQNSEVSVDLPVCHLFLFKSLQKCAMNIKIMCK